MSGQTAANATATPDPLNALAQWNYGFATRRQYAAQDQLTLAPLALFNVDTDWKPTGLVGTLSTAPTSNAQAMGVTPRAPGCWVLDVLVYDYVDGADQPTSILDLQNQIYPVSASSAEAKAE